MTNDIQTYLDSATFALNRAIGLLLSEEDSAHFTKPIIRNQIRKLQNARDITVAIHKELSDD